MLNRSVISSRYSTRAFFVGMSAFAVYPVTAQEQINFGEVQLFDFANSFDERTYSWSSGDALITDINFDKQLGGIVGREDGIGTPAVVIGGTTIIPAITADTRTGLRLTTSYEGRAGVELNAGMTVGGGDNINASIYAGPTLSLAGPSVAGQFVRLGANTALGSNTTFDPGLPSFNAGMNAVLSGDFQNKIEYAVPLNGLSVGEFGFDFDLNLSLFDINFDLNLPDLPTLNFPGFPEFTIPDFSNDDDPTAFRQQLPPPSDPTMVTVKPTDFLSLGEVAIDNPARTVESESEIKDGVASFSAGGSLLRAGIDIDGITSGLLSGGVSFTGTSVKVGPAKLSYDLIDVKYGVELGFQYNTELDTALNVELTFDHDVLLRDAQGTEVIADTFTGRWDELPEIALLDREDVEVAVDFTDIEAFFSQQAELTVSDYMELQALRLKAKVATIGPEVGPLIYKRFPLAGELTAFEIFETDPTSIGKLSAGTFWDGAFTLQAADIKEVYLKPNATKLHEAGGWIDLATGGSVTSLSDKSLIIGIAGADPVDTRLDIAPVYFADSGIPKTLNWTVFDPPLSFDGFSATVSDITQRTAIDGLIVQAGAVYDVNAQRARLWELNYIENDGRILGNGHLDFEAGNSFFDIQGSGEIFFDSYGTITADRLRHGEGHTIIFDKSSDEVVNFGISGIPNGGFLTAISDTAFVGLVQNGTPVATSHILDVDKLNNAGTITVQDTTVSVAASEIDNAPIGILQATDGGTFNLNGTNNYSDTFLNSGVIRAVGTDSSGNASKVSIDAFLVGGVSNTQGIGHVYAEDGGVVQFTAFTTGTVDQQIEAKAGGAVIFDDRVDVLRDTTLTTQVGGTMTLSGGLELLIEGELEIVNHGTLNVDGSTSLIALNTGPNSGSSGTIRPLDLTNTGTVNVRNGSRFTFGVAIDDFTNDGATLVGGTWNVLGATGSFSNLSDLTQGISSIDARVLEVVPDDQFLGDVFDLTIADTRLKTNAANVTLQGRALFPYFNTIETNRGTFNITQGHRFTTAGTLTNDGGTINVDSGADLLVQGALIVNGGSVNVGGGSTVTLQTVTQTLIDEDTLETFTQQKTLEVLGGAFNYNAPGSLADATPMFSPAQTASAPDGLELNAGQFWTVREQVTADSQGNEVVNAAAINLNGGKIIHNQGTITIDGAAASFDAAEYIVSNFGTLNLQNGFEFNNRDREARTFSNRGDLNLTGASFIFDNDSNSTFFFNNGKLSMDRDSYFKTDEFINGAGSTFHLDGILDAGILTIDSGSSLSGTGFITGVTQNRGTLNIGNSPGIIEVFGSYSHSNNATIVFEIEGFEAGTSYDQLILTQVDAPDAPTSFAFLGGGTLELNFDSALSAFGREWTLIDTGDPQGVLFGEFDFIETQGLSEAPGTIEDYSLWIQSENDILLGELNGVGVFLTYTGGDDGNDLVVYAVPDSTFLAGDYNADGFVSQADLDLVLLNWGETAVPADFDEGSLEGGGPFDGLLSQNELDGVLLNWGNGASPMTVPEPGSLALLTLAGAASLTRRRRSA